MHTNLGDFRVMERLAVGGMAEIYLARARTGPRAGKRVVLKRLLPALRSNPQYIAHFEEEARLGAQLDHPNIVRHFGLYQRGADFYIVQELVGGETLQNLARRSRAGAPKLGPLPPGARLSPAATLHAMTGLLAALEYLHAAPVPGAGPIVHRDVNPDNLVARPDGVVKLIDFGIAERSTPDQLTPAPVEGALRGTPAYMSPEQVRGRGVGPASDLFCAGIVLWELLAARPLFHAETEFETLRRVKDQQAPPLRAVWPEAPTRLERLCVRALAKEPASRFSSAAEMSAAVRDAIEREALGDGAAALGEAVRRLAPGAPAPD